MVGLYGNGRGSLFSKALLDFQGPRAKKSRGMKQPHPDAIALCLAFNGRQVPDHVLLVPR